MKSNAMCYLVIITTSSSSFINDFTCNTRLLSISFCKDDYGNDIDGGADDDDHHHVVEDTRVLGEEDFRGHTAKRLRLDLTNSNQVLALQGCFRTKTKM